MGYDNLIEFPECNATLNSSDVNNVSIGNASDDCGIVLGNWIMPKSDFDILWLPAVKSIVIFLYVVVIAFGGLGNLLVVITVTKTKQLWNATNMFIVNLAVADIFVCVFDLPLSLHYQLTGNWAFGKVLCHVIMMVFGVVVYTSTLTLTMIAIDRYILIVHPHKRRMSVSNALLIMLLIAIVSMAVASPIAVYSKYVEYNISDLEIHRILCKESFPSIKQKKLYTVMTLLVQFILPVALILVLYSRIFLTLRRKMSRKSSRKTKTTKMLVAVVTVFAVMWTPFHLYALIIDFTHDVVPGRYLLLIDVLLKVFALSSSCVNPLLYGWMNDNYRTAFFSIIRRPTKTPAGIHREDSEEVSKAAHGANTVNVTKTDSVVVYQNMKPGSPSVNIAKNEKLEMVPIRSGPLDVTTPVSVTAAANNGHYNPSYATPQTPLLT